MDHPDFIEQTKNLEKKLNITIRYSSDKTGNKTSMGDWIQESHNVSIKTKYFNSYINNWNHLLTSNITQSTAGNYTITISGDNYNNFDYYINGINDNTTILSSMPLPVHFMLYLL